MSSPSAIHESICTNCGGSLSGPFCSHCGQHAHASARSMSTLFHDAWHVMTHADSRAWRTLLVLLCRPGLLTWEYFQDRRERYLPPVRLYLIASVVFFSFVALQGGSKHGAATETGPRMVDCSEPDDQEGRLGDWVRAACARVQAAGGDTVEELVRHNIPRMMFVFLPLMAAVLLLLYWRPRHLYVEHLVFFLHAHAALYLVLALTWTLQALSTRWALPAALTGWMGKACALYALWYMFCAMRRCYGQGRRWTVLKLAIVSAAYMVSLVLMLMLTVAVSVLQA